MPATSIPNKLHRFIILALEKNPLIFVSAHEVFELIELLVVVKLVGDERQDSVDGVILGRNVIDGCFADEYGEDETYDGREYLADVGAGLPFLEMEVFEEESFDLMAWFVLSRWVLHESENISIMLDLYAIVNLIIISLDLGRIQSDSMPWEKKW